MGLVVDLGPHYAVANPLNIHLKGYPAKVVTRAYHLYAMPRSVNRWAMALAYLTDVLFPRTVVSTRAVVGERRRILGERRHSVAEGRLNPMKRTADELLTAVERSPRAAAAHDRPGWVGLFTADGCVEDPVGSRPHVGHAQIGRFYDTFIGPRQITFHRGGGHRRRHTIVVRDVTLEVTMGSGVRLMVPTFIRYDLHAIESDWKFSSLRAYWEFPVMVTEFLLRNCQWRKLIAAGTTVAAAVMSLSGPGVVFVDVDTRDGRIIRTEYLRSTS